jgi:hypothetical protein
MAVYRFRVFIEDNHEIYRDIEILGRHDFADLHRSIVTGFNFVGGQPAEYVTSDSTWYEGEDVVALDADLNGKPARIVSHINDPHQRFLCVTISFKQVGLALELLKILPEVENVFYPRVVKTHGDAPFYTQPPVKPISSDVEDDEDEKEKKKSGKKGAALLLDEEPTDDQLGEEDTDLLHDDTESGSNAPAGDDDDDVVGAGGDGDDDDEDGEDDPGFSNFDMDEL